MSRITALAYSVLYLLALPVIVMRLLWTPGPALLRQRFGFGLPQVAGRSIWLHASSVGEVALLEPLVTELQARYADSRVLVTAFTSTGVATAARRFPQHAVCALPFDFAFCVNRFLRHFDPRIAIVVESEFWPRLLGGLERRRVPVVALNVRMSERSLAVHERTRFVAEALRSVAVVAVQDEANAQRLRRLGLDPQRIHTTGNMKYDLVSPVEGGVTRADLGIDDDAFVIVGGSLHDREDEALLDAIYAPLPVTARTTTLIAPRYPAAAARMLSAARARGLRAALKSAVNDSGERVGELDVCVIDTLGELRGLYAIANVAFVGGSLYYRGSNRGGHNLMEPAICAVPVLFGPFNYSFAEIARELVQHGGGREVRNPAEIRAALESLQRDSRSAAAMGKAAKGVVLAGQGATRLNVRLAIAQLEQGSH